MVYISYMEKINVNFNILKKIKSELRLKNVVEEDITNTISKLYQSIKNYIEYSTKVSIEVNKNISIEFYYESVLKYNNYINQRLFNVKILTNVI